MKFKEGDKVYVAYISTEDECHHLRHNIIWQEARLIYAVKHPSGLNWFDVKVVLDKPFILNGKNRKTFSIGKCQLKLVEKSNEKKQYTVLNDKRQSMLEDINHKLKIYLSGQPLEEDWRFWLQENKKGKELECKYKYASSDSWYPVKSDSGTVRMFKSIEKDEKENKYDKIIIFRYKEQK